MRLAITDWSVERPEQVGWWAAIRNGYEAGRQVCVDFADVGTESHGWNQAIPDMCHEGLLGGGTAYACVAPAGTELVRLPVEFSKRLAESSELSVFVQAWEKGVTDADEPRSYTLEWKGTVAEAIRTGRELERAGWSVPRGEVPVGAPEMEAARCWPGAPEIQDPNPGKHRPSRLPPQLANARVRSPGMLLRLCVSEAGQVARVLVLESSGNPDVDKYYTTELSKWRFPPAEQDGRRVRSVVPVTVNLSVK